MNTSQLVKNLQNRLSSLLNDPVFAKARQDRAAQKVGIIEDALIAHNMAVSEELLQLDASSIIGEVKEKNLETRLQLRTTTIFKDVCTKENRHDRQKRSNCDILQYLRERNKKID